MLTQKYVRECFDYEPETGELRWKRRPAEHFNTWRGCNLWNSNFADKIAGSLDKSKASGYLRVRLNGKLYQVHRIIWLIVYSYFPEEIDHIDHNRKNNKLSNLREVMRADNVKNKSVYCLNTSGYTGVSWFPQTRKWKVAVNISGKQKSIGYFSDIRDAVSAAQAIYKSNDYHENHGK